MERNLRYTRQGRTPKSRTSNACEACKRRKTKCSGGPSPCDVCKRAETFCNFNPKLDTRRKLAYNSTTIQDRQQFMLTALLQTIKHCPEDELNHLTSLIRGPSRPDAVAQRLRHHFSSLQSKGIIPMYDIDDTDVISFGLQGLCGHRKGRARPKSPTSATEPSHQDQSPAHGADSQESFRDAEDDHMFDDDDGRSRFSSPLNIDNDESFDPVHGYDTAGLLNSTQLGISLPHETFLPEPSDTSSSSLRRNDEHSQHAFQRTPGPSHFSGEFRSSEVVPTVNGHSSRATTLSNFGETPDSFSQQHISPSAQHFAHGPERHESSSHAYLLHYYNAVSNGVPTLDPGLAAKFGQQMYSQPGQPGNMQEEFGAQQFAFYPLRSNA